MSTNDPVWDVDGFVASGAASDLPEPVVRSVAEVLVQFFDMHGVAPARLDGADVHDVVGHAMPPMLRQYGEHAPIVMMVLRRYFAWLDEKGAFSDGYEVRQALENVAPEFIEAVRTGRVAHHGHAGHPGHAHEGHAHGEGDGTGGGARSRVGRNDPCPCGSGRKHKKCCGA